MSRSHRGASAAKQVAALVAITCFVSPVLARDVYLLMGQSNMSGRGSRDELPEQLRRSGRQVLLYGNDRIWRAAVEPLDTARGQRDQVSSDADAAVGPGLAFGRAIRRASGHDVALVPCAKGGSAMREWAPAVGRQTLYGSCLLRARAAARRGRIAGVLWYQGETDARQHADAAAWRGAFEAMLRRLRADLQDADLPVVLVGLADPPETGPYANGFPAWAEVQAAQRSVAACRAVTVSAAGLERKADRLHLTTAAAVRLGQELAAAMARLRRSQPCRTRLGYAPSVAAAGDVRS